MERRLRNKFIFISCGVVLFVLVTMAIVMNLSSYLQIGDRADEIIDMMGENDGDFPAVMAGLEGNAPPTMGKQTGHINVETPYTTRYFTVKMDENGNLISANTRNIQMVDTDRAIAYANEVMGTTSGYADYYRYQVMETDYGSLMIFVDCTQDITMFYSFLESSLLVCGIALLGVFILMLGLSKKAVAPIVESYQKQQQFITNITHELKTPLAIIKTNTEVIEMEGESSQWSTSIHNQIGRLNELVNHLVSLSKLEEGAAPLIMENFSLGDAITEVVESFDLLAESQGQQIVRRVPEKLSYWGDEQSIRLLVSILLDNALKYSLPQTEVELTVTRYLGRPVIQLTNRAEGLEKGKYNNLFDRFYRMEGSRNSKLGGFGIGLAMAQSIVLNHEGDITAYSPDGQQMIIRVEL